MTVNVVPHLNFRGQARAALEFYRTVFGGELTIITQSDMGAVEDPAEAQHVTWGQVDAPDGFRIMAFDVPASRPFDRGDAAFFVSVRGDDTDELTVYWEQLSEGATVIQPLAPSAWAPMYGMLEDRFGVTWVLDVVGEYVPD